MRTSTTRPSRLTRPRAATPARRLATVALGGLAAMATGVALLPPVSAAPLPRSQGVPAATPPTVTAISRAAANRGLAGAQDATYDGVYRQGLAILGWRAAGVTPPASAVSWLRAQQCRDGGFEPFRASTTAPCRAGSLVTYNGQDTNSTALGALALLAIGDRTRAARSIAWLRASQNRDGGFPFFRGGTSDVNSTGLVVAALRSAGLAPTGVAKSGRRTVAAYLASAQLRCSAPATARGALAFQVSTPLAGNDLATAQVAAGLLAVPPSRTGAMRAGSAVIPCGGSAAAQASVSVGDAAAGYLARRLTATRGRLPSAFGGGVDWSATAWAVLALAGSRSGRVGLTHGANALSRNVNAYVRDRNKVDQPAALGLLILVARSLGLNPTRFGGVNLPARLTATVRA